MVTPSCHLFEGTLVRKLTLRFEASSGWRGLFNIANIFPDRQNIFLKLAQLSDDLTLKSLFNDKGKIYIKKKQMCHLTEFLSVTMHCWQILATFPGVLCNWRPMLERGRTFRDCILKTLFRAEFTLRTFDIFWFEKKIHLPGTYIGGIFHFVPFFQAPRDHQSGTKMRIILIGDGKYCWWQWLDRCKRWILWIFIERVSRKLRSLRALPREVSGHILGKASHAISRRQQHHWVLNPLL